MDVLYRRWKNAPAAALLFVATLALAAGCGKSGSTVAPETPPPSYPTVFTAWPIDSNEFAYIVPLGSMNPPGHTMPVDHVYFYIVNPDSNVFEISRLRPLYVPAAGRVVDIRRGVDDALTIQMNSRVSYYMNHTHLAAGIAVGSELVAGQVLGTTSAAAFAFDIGVVDLDIQLPLIRPDRYPYSTPHAGKPIGMFAEPLRSSIVSRVRRVGADYDGRVDYDVPGTLSGCWFLLGLPVADSPYNVSGPKQLAFAADPWHPTWQSVSLGGVLGITGAFLSGTGEPAWASVTPASGEVAYTLRWPADGPASQVFGTMRVQLLAPDTLKMEAFTGLAVPAPAFTDSAKIFVR
jgi:hypothetical protein